MRRSIVVLVSLFGVLVAVPPAVADGPALAGRVELSGAAPAYAPVVLDRPLTLDLADDTLRPAGKVAGKAPFKGFVLRHDGPNHDEPGLAVLGLFGDGFAFVEPIGSAHDENDESENHYYVRLPAGQYRMYLLTDGSPVTGTLTLPGLDGTVTVTPTVPEDMHVAQTPRLDGGPLTNSAVFGTTALLTTPGMIYTELDVDSMAEAASRLELCIYGPTDDHSGADAFSRGCPGSTETPGDPTYVGDPDIPPGAIGQGYSEAAWGVPAGSWGLGGNILSVGAPPDVSAISAWLSFGPPSPPAAPVAAPATPIQAAKPRPHRRHRAKHRRHRHHKRAHHHSHRRHARHG